ncbi:folate family ECF transporter S component [Christensenellaceae bacterium OttesenSCG-928-M15]|nr:folate family ECF transporter S component [Christensenellaceae bacterium OttesenSCG-928-M15]
MQIKSQTKRLVLCALFVALGAIFSGALSIPVYGSGMYTMKVSLGMVPVIMAGILYGPVYGGIVGGLTDLVQVLMFPKMGAYQPWFTVVAIFFGLIPGLFFMKQQKLTLKRIFAAVFSGQVFSSVICNTALMVWLYNADPLMMVTLRGINQAIMIPVFSLLIYWLAPLIEKRHE